MVDLKQIAVAAAVAILFAVFIALLTELVYPQPNYNDFCEDIFNKARPFPLFPEPVDKCGYEYQNSSDYQQCINEGATPVFNYSSGCPIYESCSTCNKDFDQATKEYNRNVFLITGAIGVIAIFAGTLWGIEFLGTGLMFGGILLLFYATVRYFSDADKLLRVIIVLAELLIVVWIGYKKLYKKGGKKRKK
ncbi:MAG: hypothetical protein HYT70_04635 [Candidatus Aenigmarchaeota archaeon]|nr:hypothetical protein [Candidatus Aenigmarchaeota archaeon]